MGSCQTELWTRQTSLPRTPRLLLCYLSSSLLSGFLTLSSHGHHSQSCHRLLYLSTSVLFLGRRSRVSFLPHPAVLSSTQVKDGPDTLQACLVCVLPCCSSCKSEVVKKPHENHSMQSANFLSFFKDGFILFLFLSGLLQVVTAISPLLASPLALMTNSWRACHLGFFYSIYALHRQLLCGAPPPPLPHPPFFIPACLLGCSTVALQSCKVLHHAAVSPAMSQACDYTDFLFPLFILHLCGKDSQMIPNTVVSQWGLSLPQSLLVFFLQLLHPTNLV